VTACPVYAGPRSGGPARFGMGFGLPSPTVPLPNPNTIFWGGYGGSLAIIDLDARTSFAYVMNRLAGPMWDARGLGLVTAMWGALGAILAVPVLAILKIISDRLRPLKALGHFLEGE